VAKVRTRPETGTLYLDFQYRGARCREQTALPDTPANRKTMEGLARKVERSMASGDFDYAQFFPDSPRATSTVYKKPGEAAQEQETPTSANPTFREFANIWYAESVPRWRAWYRDYIRATLDRALFPVFGDKHLEEISRADLLGFRAQLALRNGRGGQMLSAKRNNKLMALVRTILNEGCDRHGLVSPGRGIKPLKQKRSEVSPFTMEEAESVIANVRADYRAYLTLRMYSGLRTGEANGLQWGDIDFEKGTIRIERTVSRKGDGETKTEDSRRTISMVPAIRAALEEHRPHALPGCPWVFHNRQGHPIDEVNFTNRVWYPLLRLLDLKKRPPYQMRHTAATLMLASGENPEWVAATLGHTTTEMLFRVYSRFIPNLTRNDGHAYMGLLRTGSPVKKVASPPPTVAADLDAMTPKQLRATLAQLLNANAKQGGSHDHDQ